MVVHTYLHTHSSFRPGSISSNLQAAAHDNIAIRNNRFLIGREKPGMQSEVARLISETLEQEKSQQHQQHLDDHYEHSTEEVGCSKYWFQPPLCASLALHSNWIFLAVWDSKKPSEKQAGRRRNFCVAPKSDNSETQH